MTEIFYMYTVLVVIQLYEFYTIELSVGLERFTFTVYKLYLSKSDNLHRELKASQISHSFCLTLSIIIAHSLEYIWFFTYPYINSIIYSHSQCISPLCHMFFQTKKYTFLVYLSFHYQHKVDFMFYSIFYIIFNFIFYCWIIHYHKSLFY